MFAKRMTIAGLVFAAGLGLAACTDGYGYSGVSVGYGSGGYYDDYYDPYYGNGYYSSAYGDPYWGWYGDYYYPGTGYYVYDRYRRPYRWNDSQRRYWESRRHDWRGDHGGNHWGGLGHDRGDHDRGDHDWRGNHDRGDHDWRGNHDRGDRGDRDDHRWNGDDRGHWQGRGNDRPTANRTYQRRNAAGAYRARHEARERERRDRR